MVLSIGTDGDSDYYLKHMSEYYTGGAEPIGRWYMPSSARMALADSGEIDPEILKGLMTGVVEGVKVGKDPVNKRLKRVSSYDMTFSCPKSVSILWALAESTMRAKIDRIVHDSVRATLGTM